MYLDFLYVILDNFSTLTKNERRFEWGIPIIFGMVGVVVCLFINPQMQYDLIKEIITFLGILLGFTLASLTLILSNDNVKSTTQQCSTERKIRGRTISLYRLVVVSFSYLIIMETILCVLYYMGILFNDFNFGKWAIIANTIFLILSFNILLATIRTTTMLYFIVVRK